MKNIWAPYFQSTSGCSAERENGRNKPWKMTFSFFPQLMSCNHVSSLVFPCSTSVYMSMEYKVFTNTFPSTTCTFTFQSDRYTYIRLMQENTTSLKIHFIKFYFLMQNENAQWYHSLLVRRPPRLDRHSGEKLLKSEK